LVRSATAFVFEASGVGNKPESIASVRRADSASWQYGRPDRVAFAFQIIGHGVKPSVPNRVCNLLAKDFCRASLADELEPIRPQVAIVFDAFLLSSRAERLARAGTGPRGEIVRESRKTKCERPTADSSEEMAL
jgi:hypothetical protein